MDFFIKLTLVEDNVFPLGWILSANAVTSFISLSALQSLVPLIY